MIDPKEVWSGIAESGTVKANSYKIEFNLRFSNLEDSIKSPGSLKLADKLLIACRSQQFFQAALLTHDELIQFSSIVANMTAKYNSITNTIDPNKAKLSSMFDVVVSQGL